MRSRFNHLFYNILKKQLLLKGVVTEEDWESWQESLNIEYVRDSHFTELKEAELLRERIQTLDMMQQYVGEFFSKEYVMKNVLFMDDDQIKDMKSQIEDEVRSGEINNDDEEQQQPDEN